MTTIAYKDGWLAVDSATTGGTRYYGSVDKYIKGNGWAAAVCGGLSMAGAMRQALLPLARVDFTEPPQDVRQFLRDNDELVFVTREGAVYSCWKEGCTRVFGGFYAAGSGDAVAIGAMAAGATAEEAVRIACKYDTATREPVIAFKV